MARMGKHMPEMMGFGEAAADSDVYGGSPRRRAGTKAAVSEADAIGAATAGRPAEAAEVARDRTSC